MSLRKTTSLTALLSFILLTITSIAVYLAPRGHRSGQWEWLGVEKHEWQALHTNLGILLLIACIVHIILNFKPIITYLRNKQKNFRLFTVDFNIALLLTVWIIVSTIFKLPPINFIQDFKQARRHEPAATSPKAEPRPLSAQPPFRFRKRTLAKICAEYSLDQEMVIQQLMDLGIETKPEWSIKTIAENNDMEPHALFETIRQISQ